MKVRVVGYCGLNGVLNVARAEKARIDKRGEIETPALAEAFEQQARFSRT